MDLLHRGHKCVTVNNHDYVVSFLNVDAPHALSVHGGRFVIPGTRDVVSAEIQ